MTSLSAALGVLTAMITPALLISASGMYILSTSNRLGRVVDRVRNISDRMDALMHDQSGLELMDERKSMLMEQMRHQSGRANVLQHALMVFYVASGIFVLTSVAIGVDALFSHARLHWMPVGLGIGGACCLLYGSILLIKEARMAVLSLNEETAFLNKLVETNSNRNAIPTR
ncbi:MAG: DUF2721 domain-containing protein [Bryobacteraceae bacterium]|nr:DUF2721 domain-containing protein [Bryobacteraceae bacterium]